MTSDTSAFPEAPPPPQPTAAQPAARGWTGRDLAVGGALVVLLIAIFLPWFTGTDGPTSHGYIWTVFVLAIVALIVLVARDAIDRLPGNLPSPEQMLVGATGLALLLTILGVVQQPSVTTISGPVISQVSAGWSYGGFVALLAALIAFIAAFGLTGSRALALMPKVRKKG